MVITHKLAMNLEEKERMPRIEVSQWDAYARKIRLLLFEGKNPWNLPEDAAVVIRYEKPDGTRGAYDTLPNGEQAWEAQDHILTLTLAPQMTTVPGTVMLYAAIFREEAVLTTFAVEICVLPAQQQEANDTQPGDYFTLTGVLPAPEAAEIGQYIRVLDVNADGKVIRLEAADMPEAGVDEQQVRSIVEDYCQENIAADSVLYTAQALNEEQKAQARTNIDVFGKDITWADVGEKDTVFVEANDVTFTDDGVIFEYNGIPNIGDFVTLEFDGVSGVYEVVDMFGAPTVEAPGVVLGYIDGELMAFVEDTTQPHSIKMSGKLVTRLPDRFAAEPYAVFYLDQSKHTYLCYDMLGAYPITKDDLLAAITKKPVIISLGSSEFYSPIVVDPYDGERTYGSATIMKSDGTIKTYYTSEYTKS